MTEKITVIIPVFNSLEYTKDALYRLSNALHSVRGTYWMFDLVLVDDGSTDGTSDWVSQHYPKTHICKGNGKLWWGGSMNTGMKYAIEKLKSDYIIWWNNDIYPAEDYFTSLTKLLSETKNPTVFGSKIYNAEKPEILWSFGGVFDHRWGHSYILGSDCPDGKMFSEAKEVDWLPGMGTVLPVMVINKTGQVNDKDFPQYHGDIDYTYRARLSGFSVQVRPELRIWNHTHHSGLQHHHALKNLIPTLRNINSIHHLGKEWLLYRKYAKTPLAYLMVIKKYIVYLMKYLVVRKG